MCLPEHNPHQQAETAGHDNRIETIKGRYDLLLLLIGCKVDSSLLDLTSKQLSQKNQKEKFTAAKAGFSLFQIQRNALGTSRLNWALKTSNLSTYCKAETKL
jgi:hypothetical protein